MILNHVSIGTKDLEKAVEFYDAVLSTLDIKRSHYIENITAGYDDNMEFWVTYPWDGQASSGNGVHIAFSAPSKESVDSFDKTAIELGGTCEGKPGLRPIYSETYYAAFVQDLDGNKIEAVCL